MNVQPIHSVSNAPMMLDRLDGRQDKDRMSWQVMDYAERLLEQRGR